MLREIDNYFLQQPEPIRSSLLTMRAIILTYDKNLTEAWKYRMPFYCYKGKMCCYLWVDKKSKKPYLGIVDGRKLSDKDLVQGNRARMKIFMIDPDKDIPQRTVQSLLKKIISLY